MPESFTTSPEGRLFSANGIDPVLRWDGFADEMEDAGVLPPGEAITLAGGGGVGTITGTYYAYVRYVDRDGLLSNLSPVSAGVTLASKLKVTYSGLPVPAEAKVARRQVLRNTAGQTRVFYVDIDTDDLVSPTMESTRTDSQLQVQDYQALLDDKNRPLANIHGVPPSDKACLVAHLDRLFGAGEQEYAAGCVSVTAGSLSVRGIGTEWPASFAGRYLWVESADKAYEIDSVDAEAQTLTLLEAYGGQTDAYAVYAVRPPIAQRRILAFSEPGLPESWPATNGFSIQEDGDDITGLMPKGSFVYVLERRHVYRCTFQEDPLTDGFVFLSLGRGCVNNRCWVIVDDIGYMLDEGGVYSFSGGQETQAVSEPIQDIFSPAGRAAYAVRWEARRWFHSCWDPGSQLIRWFVTLSGTGVPRHALCLDVRQGRWWVEEYPVPIGASCVGTLDGLQRVFLGGPGGQVFLLGDGTLDGVDPGKGTVRGTVTSAGLLGLTDSLASFGPDLVGAFVVITDGRGKRQRRRIVAATGTTLRLDTPWLVKPDTTSTYQVGGVQYRYRTGWFRWAPQEQEGPRRLEVSFEPCDGAATLDARLWYDRSKSPVEWDYECTSADGDGVSVIPGSPDLTVDLTKPIGLVQKRLDGHKEVYVDGPRLVSVGIDGATGTDEVRIHSMTLDGAR